MNTGTRLGPYEILSAIGEGGMGQVFKARDTRLDRTVAIKILASNMTGRPEVLQRFEREARVISTLNHPNICTLHDVAAARRERGQTEGRSGRRASRCDRPETRTARAASERRSPTTLTTAGRPPETPPRPSGLLAMHLRITRSSGAGAAKNPD